MIWLSPFDSSMFTPEFPVMSLAQFTRRNRLWVVALSFFPDHYARAEGHVYVRSHDACKPIELGATYLKQYDSPPVWLTE